MEISSSCSACTKGVCSAADTQLCENLQGAVKCVLCLIISKSISVKKLEDRASDESCEEDGQITLSLHHLDSDHFLGSDSEDNCFIQSVARKSMYAPRQPVRKSPRETAQAALRDSAAQSTSKPTVKRSYPPARKSNSEARARRARAKQEDKRSDGC